MYTITLFPSMDYHSQFFVFQRVCIASCQTCNIIMSFPLYIYPRHAVYVKSGITRLMLTMFS